MEIIGIILLVAAICNFLLGLFVFLKEPSKRLNQLFGIFGFITAIWVFTNLISGVLKTLFWLKGAYAFGVLVPVFALLWVLDLCDRKLTKPRVLLISGLAFFFFSNFLY